MRRLSRRFGQLAAAGEKALIAFVTAGDPSAEESVDLALAIADAGADALEIGIPFSDPLADGPSIQASSQRALNAGMTTRGALQVVHRIRERNAGVPLILMTYYNPILHYGLERYGRDAADAGADAHIVTDLTPEEAARWIGISEQNNLDTVFLLAPTSTAERIEIVASVSTGFVYCVSRTGVTGPRQDVPPELRGVVRNIRRCTNTPICVGFGISRPEHVRRICGFADGAVVGSALVDLIHEHRAESRAAVAVGAWVRELKRATRDPRPVRRHDPGT